MASQQFSARNLHHPNPRQDEERIHDLIRWCMGMGADPRAVALRADAMSVGLPPSPPGTGWKVDLPARVVGLVLYYMDHTHTYIYI